MRKWFQDLKQGIGNIVFLAVAVSKEDVVIHLIRDPLDPQLVPDIDCHWIAWGWDGTVLVFDLLVNFLVSDLLKCLKRGLLVEKSKIITDVLVEAVGANVEALVASKERVAVWDWHYLDTACACRDHYSWVSACEIQGSHTTQCQLYSLYFELLEHYLVHGF